MYSYDVRVPHIEKIISGNQISKCRAFGGPQRMRSGERTVLAAAG